MLKITLIADDVATMKEKTEDGFLELDIGSKFL